MRPNPKTLTRPKPLTDAITFLSGYAGLIPAMRDDVRAAEM
jgi:hypothetical protein